LICSNRHEIEPDFRGAVERGRGDEFWIRPRVSILTVCLSLNQLARRLNAEGLPTARGAASWTSAGVSRSKLSIGRTL
jgi:hypothetical protein